MGFGEGFLEISLGDFAGFFLGGDDKNTVIWVCLLDFVIV